MYAFLIKVFAILKGLILSFLHDTLIQHLREKCLLSNEKKEFKSSFEVSEMVLLKKELFPIRLVGLLNILSLRQLKKRKLNWKFSFKKLMSPKIFDFETSFVTKLFNHFNFSINLIRFGKLDFYLVKLTFLNELICKKIFGPVAGHR